MSYRYTPAEIEPKWQTVWEEQGLYKTREDPKKPKWYALTMLPYPSGDLHTGHWYAYTPSDAGARFKRMNGYNVFFPIGFDAFGLPAENAAIKQRRPSRRSGPMPTSSACAANCARMGAMWAWDHEAVSCDPEYYKWSQWFFRKFYDAGMAYREYAPVDWCPNCNTTLAREQVWGDDRHCERCGTPVIKKNLEQWKFRITKYADELLDGLETDRLARARQGDADQLDRPQHRRRGGLPDRAGRRRWRSSPPGPTRCGAPPSWCWPPSIRWWTRSRPPTAAPRWTRTRPRPRAWTRSPACAPDKEKTGVFTGGYAINPVNGERIPIWIADYVMMGYGTGAIMAVPGARRARLCLCHEVRPGDPPRHHRPRRRDRPAWPRPTTPRTKGELINSGAVRRHAGRRAPPPR